MHGPSFFFHSFIHFFFLLHLPPQYLDDNCYSALLLVLEPQLLLTQQIPRPSLNWSTMMVSLNNCNTTSVVILLNYVYQNYYILYY